MGNLSTGTQTINWTVNRSALIAVSNLQLSPDNGFSNTDGITNTRSFTLSFALSNNATQLKVLHTDLSGETVVAVRTNVAAGGVSIPLALLSGGNAGIKVIATGSNGAEGMAQRNIFIDEAPLNGRWNFDNNQQISRQPDTISFSISSKLLSAANVLSAISLNKNAVPLLLNNANISIVNDTLIRVIGLRQKITTEGTYNLRINLPLLAKYSSGTTGDATKEVSWNVLSSNRAPIANAGNDMAVNAIGTYSLTALASTDPDLNTLTCKWLAPAGIVLSDSTSSTPSFTIAAANQLQSYSFLLIVSDGNLISTDVVGVNVNRLVTFNGLANSYCSNAGSVTLTGTPTGGVFSGPGISSNTFNPTVAGAGEHTIVYTKDGLLFSRTVVVNNLVLPLFNPLAAICIGTAAPALPARSLNGINGTWNPSIVSNTVSATYTFTPLPGQCATSAIISITILPKPGLGLDIVRSKCSGSAYDLTSEDKIAGVAYAYFNSAFTIIANPAAVETGVYNIVATNSNGCRNTALVTVSNFTKPNLGLDITRSTCTGFGFNLTTIYTDAALTYTYFTQAFATVSTPPSVGTGLYNIVATNSNGCKDTAQVTVTNFTKPNLGVDITRSKCPGFTFNLNTVYNPAGSTFTYFTQAFAVITNSSAAEAGAYIIVASNADGCKDTAQVTVVNLLKPNLGADTTLYHVCAGETTNLIPLYNTAGLTASWNFASTAAAT